jgi:hypothetical protein
LGVFLGVTNALAGYYPLTLSGAGGSYNSYSTNVNLFVVPQWIITNNTANWSSGSSWSSGLPPQSTDSVYIENEVGGFTNVVDSTRSIMDLTILGDVDANSAVGLFCGLQIPTGVTLSVLGTNGLYIGVKANNSCRPVYNITGAGALVVSNSVANFDIANGASSTRFLTVIMTNLANFSTTVSRFGVSDLSSSFGGLYGASLVNFYLARTNYIQALYSENYGSDYNFQNSIQFEANGNIAGGGANAVFALGLTNGIYADSIGVGRGGAQGTGSVNLSGGGNTLKFLSIYSNSVSPVASAYFRNTNGGRMSVLAVGADSGTASSSTKSKGSVALQGGKIDMQVDQIWLGRNRTNSTSSSVIQGALLFDWGKVDANTVIVGDMQYTNSATVNGYLSVGVNGTLTVNSNLVLGYTLADNTADASAAAACSGWVQINNGGAIRANQVTPGLWSTGNQITINAGGLLDVTNGIGTASQMLPNLTNNGGGLTFHLNGLNPVAYIKNLASGPGSAINIASVSGISSYPQTFHLIQYNTAVTPSDWVGGTAPAGLSVAVANNSGNNSIDITLSAGSPKSLLWKGYQNNNWDTVTKNWLDLNTGLATNFATLDAVYFDDTATYSTISVTEDVVPAQTAGGMTMTNNSLSYTFTGSGEIIGGATLEKYGTMSLTVDLYTEFAALVNRGSLDVTANGTIGSASVANGAYLANNGTVIGSLTCAGAADNFSTVNGAVTVQSSGAVTNDSAGTLEGAITLQTNSLFCNAGAMESIGSSTTATNSTFVNTGAGFMYGTTLTINGTLIDAAAESVGFSAGSINVDTLAINGTFLPGGSTIGTSKVTDFTASGSSQGSPDGRVQLNAGSVTVFQVNPANGQNTVLLSGNQGFGPSQASKSINGCTLLITNVSSTPFAAGQSFQLFSLYYDSGVLLNDGLNTTNSYPHILPNPPGPGLAWDESQVISSGIISVVSAASLQTALVHNATVVGTNLITELSWPANLIGTGWVESQTVPLSTGLGTNWSTIAASLNVNDIFLTNTINANTAEFYRFVNP